MDEISSKNILIGKVHDTLYDTSRSVGVTDTILVCGTYIFNLAMLFLIAISVEKTAIYAVFIITLIIVNLLILATFKNSRQLREKMHLRQKSLYEDLGLIKHFDDSLIENYKKRYTIWISLDLVLGMMAIIVAILLKYYK
jgi:hypothetical protein